MMQSKNVFAEVRFAPEKMQKANLFETKNFFCDVYGLEPGQEQKPHAHDDADKIYFVLEGLGTFLIGSEERDLNKGDIIFAPASVPHGVRNKSGERLSLLVFMTPNPNFKLRDAESADVISN